MLGTKVERLYIVGIGRFGTIRIATFCQRKKMFTTVFRALSVKVFLGLQQSAEQRVARLSEDVVASFYIEKTCNLEEK